jgi:uncharacterized protein
MNDNHILLSLSGKSSLYQLFMSLLIIVVAGIILFTGFLVAGMVIFDTDFETLKIFPSDISTKEISFFRYILITQHISFFIIPAIIILTLMENEHHLSLKKISMPAITEITLIVILAFCLFPVTGFTAKLNSMMHLPDWLSGVEQWMKEKEDNATELIDLFMTSDTFLKMILNLMMIAVIPAVGEELIFRGVFQKIFTNMFKSGHLAIWFTAILFSTIHLQFYGFVPRVILGLVFGYLFFWSGTLWLPVISHFVNNAVPVVGGYLLGWQEVNSPSEIPLFKEFFTLLIPVFSGGAILVYFWKRSRNKSMQNY